MTILNDPKFEVFIRIRRKWANFLVKDEVWLDLTYPRSLYTLTTPSLCMMLGHMQQPICALEASS